MSRPGPRIVIVGGGFAGLYAAMYLARSEIAERGAEIVLVDRRNYFTFTPLIAEVAMGTLGREHVTYPYRVLAHRFNFRFVQDVVCRIDMAARNVSTSQTDLPFHYLVLATGGSPRFFGNESVERESLPLTSVADALAVRGRVIEALERAELTTDESERKRLLTFVVAGAGPAGVEIASGIHVLARDVLRRYYVDAPLVQVVLAAARDRILAGFDEGLAREGLSVLRARGIDVRLNTKIVRAANGVITAEGGGGEVEMIRSHTLVWTAGTGPGEWLQDQGLPLERGGVRVDEFLEVEGEDGVFAVGDVNALRDPRSGDPYPRVAPIAISQGVRAAANIENHYLGRPLEPYNAFHAGKIVSLGGCTALADILGIRITGRLAWWLYRITYLLKLVGAQNKIRLVMTLLLNRLFERDITAEYVRTGGCREER
jgi:NADH dehydrogenase